jgi:hypothetical protein
MVKLMVKITKEQKNYLIENGYLKLEEGKYPDLTICNKEHNGNSKTYFVPDFYKRYLR